jgi:hypothetical protein
MKFDARWKSFLWYWCSSFWRLGEILETIMAQYIDILYFEMRQNWQIHEKLKEQIWLVWLKKFSKGHISTFQWQKINTISSPSQKNRTTLDLSKIELWKQSAFQPVTPQNKKKHKLSTIFPEDGCTIQKEFEILFILSNPFCDLLLLFNCHSCRL